MKEGGKRLREVVNLLKPMFVSGNTTRAIDKEAERLMLKFGGEPSFKKVPGYRWSTCLPINEQIVHTQPSDRVIKDGDLVCLDIGFYYQGFHTDYATTVLIGDKKPVKIAFFLETGRKTLKKAIEKVRPGQHLGEISETIEKEIKKGGFFVIRELTGHGIGRALHEDPFVPGYLDKPLDKTPKIDKGMTLAIEVIYSIGTEKLAYEKDKNWSIVTSDGSLSACFEKTVAVTENQALVLT